MLVRDIMTYDVEAISPDADLIQTAQKLKDFQIGSLVVIQNKELLGMITDRDIAVRAVAERKNAAITSVNEIMTPDVIYCLESESIEEAAKLMEEHSIHRLLVLNIDYEPVGFISLSDIAVKSHDEHLTFEICEHISEPACPKR